MFDIDVKPRLEWPSGSLSRAASVAWVSDYRKEPNAPEANPRYYYPAADLTEAGYGVVTEYRQDRIAVTLASSHP